MANVKGTALNSTLRFITERFGQDSLQKLHGDLTPEAQAVVDRGVLVSTWYPTTVLLELMRATERRFGGQHLYIEMGRASADYGLTTVYKIFFKVGAPHFIIAKAARVFGGYYDSGRIEAVVSEPGRAVLELRDFADPAPELCDRILGWMQRTMELTGVKNLKSVHSLCVTRGDAICRFEGHWG